MKKLISMMLVLVLTMTALSGCGKTTQESSAEQSSAAEQSSTDESSVAEASEAAKEEASTEASEASEAAPAEESTEASTEPSAEASETSEVNSEEEGLVEELNIALLKGPTALGALKILQDQEDFLVSSEYHEELSKSEKLLNRALFTVAASADEILGDIIQGNIDIAAVPVNVASVLYNKTEGQVEIVAVNTLGVLYVLEKGESINSVADLKGKTIITTGQGATPEYSLRYLLTQNGLDPDTDVDIQFLSESTEVAAQMAAGSADVVMLPQPFVTSAMMQNEGWRVALDLNEEWEKLNNGTGLVTGCVIVQKALLESDPETVATFLEMYEASINYVNENVEDAAKIAEHFNIIKAAVAAKAIPECNIVYLAGEEMKDRVSGYLQILYDANPKAVGGALPADDFYYIAAE